MKTKKILLDDIYTTYEKMKAETKKQKNKETQFGEKHEP